MKYFSMFSGIGGFEYGLQQSKHDFECIGFSEIDKYASSIYTRHFPKHRNYGDATKINTEDLPDFEFLVGGFPCQAFSIAGKRKGFNEARGTLFFEIARVLRDKTPRYFLLENVKGLLSHEGGETIETIFRVCDELGYDVSWAIYNSKDYGVPQNRERIFIKGYFRGECGPEVLSQTRDCEEITGKLIKLNNKAQAQSIYDTNGLATTLSACGGGQGGKTGLYLLNGSSDGNIACIDANYHKGLGPADVKKNRRRRTHIIETDMCKPVLTPDRENKRQNGRRMKENNEPSFTLTAQDRHGVSDGYKVRRLTPKECERLQGFPDNWTKYGKDDELISDTQRYKCCGNAVTTNVITAIVNEMFEGVI